MASLPLFQTVANAQEQPGCFILDSSGKVNRLGRIKTKETGFLAASAICNLFSQKNPVFDHPLRCLETEFFTIVAGEAKRLEKTRFLGLRRAQVIFKRLETGFFTVAAGRSEETRKNPISDYPRASHIYA